MVVGATQNLLFQHWVENNRITMWNTMTVWLFSISPQRRKLKGVFRTCFYSSLLCAWLLHEGHLSRPELRHPLSAYLPLYSSSPLKYFYFTPPPFPFISTPCTRSAASPTGVTDLILFSHRALTSLSGASLPLSSFLLFSSPLTSAKLLDGEETRCEDLKPSRKQRWDEHVGAFRRLIFAAPPPPQC